MSARLSDSQRHCLESLRDYGDWPMVHGMSAHGGQVQSISALARKGLIESDRGGGGAGWKLTDAGRAAIGPGK